jgi:hypothetical protein
MNHKTENPTPSTASQIACLPLVLAAMRLKATTENETPASES